MQWEHLFGLISLKEFLEASQKVLIPLSWRVAKGGGTGGEDSPPARLKQVQFAPNRKHAFFDAMS